ncbi:MAG: hypothetical protein ACRD0G_14775 [Acidimicrobiales bacterium]
MKRVLIVVALALVGWVAVDAMGDAFQTRPDSVPPDSVSEIVLEVRENGYLQPLGDGARNLWASCAGTTSRDVVADESFVEVEPGTFRVVVQPALGEHGQERLVGCLEDLTVERLQGDVVSVRHLPQG